MNVPIPALTWLRAYDTTRFGALAAGTAFVVALIAFVAWLVVVGGILASGWLGLEARGVKLRGGIGDGALSWS